MKVFVTGHKGYIGVHLVDLLKQAGHTVTGCDLACLMVALGRKLFLQTESSSKMSATSRLTMSPVMIASCTLRRFPTIQWAR